jgi:hypothetical protein
MTDSFLATRVWLLASQYLVLSGPNNLMVLTRARAFAVDLHRAVERLDTVDH